MNQNRLRIWFSVVSLILILFGLLYCFEGLKILPVNKDVLLDWESAIYGAIMIGWGATLFLLGRLAFARQDKELMKILLYGIILWLIIEAISSFYFGVYFNVGVDIAVAILFAFPIINLIMRQAKNLRNYALILSILIANLSFKAQPHGTNGNLTVLVKNIRSAKGQIGFCLFKTSSGFPKHPEKAIQRVFVKMDGNSAEYTFTNVPFGTYAVCVFHDENDDKKINTNFIGIPTEGVGVSNNAKGHFGPPKFDDAKFNFTKTGQTLTISITYL